MGDARFLRANPNPVPLDSLKHPDFDVREYRTEEDIENIRRSLEEKGQIMPVLLGQKESGQYPILDGNHRYLAAKRAGWPDIDAIQTRTGVDSDEAQIVANISRLELAPSEKLATFDYMLNVLDLQASEAADKVGYDRSQVTRYQAILEGYGEIKEYFMEGEIGVRACYELNLVDDRDRAVDIAQTAVREGYQDADVVKQAKFARAEKGAEDAMRGAGTQENVENMQQARKQAQAIQEVDPIDQQAIDEAQVGAQGSPSGEAGDQTAEDTEEPQGPPCHACGQPMPSGAFLVLQFRPEIAKQLGVQELNFGPECMQAVLELWEGLQAEANPDTQDPVPADEPDSTASQ